MQVAYTLSLRAVNMLSSVLQTQEIYTFADLQEKFSLDRITKSAAVFDKTKLAWMNGQHLRALPDAQARRLCTSQGLVWRTDTGLGSLCPMRRLQVLAHGSLLWHQQVRPREGGRGEEGGTSALLSGGPLRSMSSGRLFLLRCGHGRV